MVHVELRFGSYLQGEAAAQPNQCHCAVLVLRATKRSSRHWANSSSSESDSQASLLLDDPDLSVLSRDDE